MAERKNLGDGELDIMLAVWAAKGPVNSAQLQSALKGRRDWQLPALLTALSRLVGKGFLSCERRGKSNLYTALVSKTDYQAQEGSSLLTRLYDGSLTALTATLVGDGAVTEAELADLRRFLEEQEKRYE